MQDAEIHLKKFQKELSAGTVSLVLLAVLARAGQPLYGYLIAKQLERDGHSVSFVSHAYRASPPAVMRVTPHCSVQQVGDDACDDHSIESVTAGKRGGMLVGRDSVGEIRACSADEVLSRDRHQQRTDSGC